MGRLKGDGFSGVKMVVGPWAYRDHHSTLVYRSCIRAASDTQLTASGSSSSSSRNLEILEMDTAPCISETIPKGSRKSGPRMMLKSVRETKAVCESSTLLIGSRRTKVANEAKATTKGAQFHAKNCVPSRYWKMRRKYSSWSRKSVIRARKDGSHAYSFKTYNKELPPRLM